MIIFWVLLILTVFTVLVTICLNQSPKNKYRYYKLKYSDKWQGQYWDPTWSIWKDCTAQNTEDACIRQLKALKRRNEEYELKDKEKYDYKYLE